MPLSPKNPLTIDNIGPLIALIDKVITIIPLLICYKYERKGEKREREKSGGGRDRKVISLSLCGESLRAGNSSPLYK